MAREDEARAREPRSDEANNGGIKAVRVEHRRLFSSEQPGEPRDGPTILSTPGHANREGAGAELPHRRLERTLGSQRSDHHGKSGLVVMPRYCPEVGGVQIRVAEMAYETVHGKLLRGAAELPSRAGPVPGDTGNPL